MIKKLLAMLGLTFILFKTATVNPNNTNLKQNVLITAGHLNEEDVKGYTLLYKDKDRDTAYYLRDDRQYSTITDKVVVVEGIGKCKVVEAYEGGFIIDIPNKNLIYEGLSGTRIKNVHGVEIGFISSLYDGKIDCKNLE